MIRMNHHAFLSVLALLALYAFPATAQEVTVQNDNLFDFGQGAIQAGFVADERAAAWLTSPCEGDILRVQVLWLSFFGNAADSLEDSITVFDAGSFPVPGAVRAELVGPLMIDGGLNEFPLPVPLPVTAGEEFVVSFRFLNSPGPFGPSVVTDTDGCQAGKNGLFAIPPSQWFSSCDLGVGGDFVIRAVVDCSGPTSNLTIFPPAGKLAETTSFDLTLIAEVPAGVTLESTEATLDGNSVPVSNCAIVGSLSPSGFTLRCPGLGGSRLGVGQRTFAATLSLSDGTEVSDSVVWEILPNTEP